MCFFCVENSRMESEMFFWVLCWLYVFLFVIKVWCIYYVLLVVFLLVNFGMIVISDDNGYLYCFVEGKCILDEDGELI